MVILMKKVFYIKLQTKSNEMALLICDHILFVQLYIQSTCSDSSKVSFLFQFSSDYDRVIAGDNWAVSESAVNDLLENDDPLAMEEFEMS